MVKVKIECHYWNGITNVYKVCFRCALKWPHNLVIIMVMTTMMIVVVEVVFVMGMKTFHTRLHKCMFVYVCERVMENGASARLCVCPAS